MSKNKSRSELIDVKELFKGYLHNWYWFVISIVLCLAAGYVYMKKHPRENLIQASILVTQDSATGSMLSGLGGLLGADPYVQDEIFVITSHAVLKSVAKDLKINKIHYLKTGFLSNSLQYPKYPIDVEADENIIDTLVTGLSFVVNTFDKGTKADIEVSARNEKIFSVKNVSLPAKLKTDYGLFTVVKTDNYPKDENIKTWISVNGYDGAAEDLAKVIMPTIASRKSNVIELSFQTTNTIYGCDILNTVMSVYNKRGIEERNQRAMATAAFIDERLALVSKALADAETQIENYKEGIGTYDVRAEAAISVRLRTEYETNLVQLETQREIMQMTQNFLKSDANKYELLPAFSFDPNTQDQTIENYNKLILNRLSLLSGAKPNNKSVKDIEAQIDALRGNILSALDRQLRSNAISIKDVQTQANMASAKLGNVPMQEREFLSLKRQQEVKQQLYLFLLQRSEETAMMIANAVSKGTIIDPAYVLRDPVGTSKMTIIILAIVFGIFLPIVFLYFKQLLRSNINGRSDIEKNTDIPILAEICYDKSGNNIVVTNDSMTSASELFRMMRTNLQFVLGNPDEKVVMVTSSKSGEGKSFISVNLAASLALLGKKVIVIGMDIRKPQLANYLGISATPGLTQYLSNSEMNLSSLIRKFDSIPGMDIIVAGPIPPNPGELMTSPRIAELINELRDLYDYIIIDTAPVGMVSDTLNLTKYVDATIFVVRDNITHIQDVRHLDEITEDGRLKRVNIVLNGSTTQKGYGYGYHK